MAIATNTLLQTMEWAKKFNFNRQSALGSFTEPAVTSANMVKQAILGPPFTWPWNNDNVTFTCVNGQQDYDVVVPDFNWIEYASVQDVVATPNKWYAMKLQTELDLDSTPGRPQSICAQTQAQDGTITFRLMPVPNAAYNVSMNIQQATSPFTGVNDTWAPIPDYMAYIYNWGFLAMMWMFADDPRYVVANQKFVAHLLATQSGLNETDRNMFLNTWPGLSPSYVASMVQGNQARAV